MVTLGDTMDDLEKALPASMRLGLSRLTIFKGHRDLNRTNSFSPEKLRPFGFRRIEYLRDESDEQR